jgi:predicted signal transduction protein with EAL and GGDEF domain
MLEESDDYAIINGGLEMGCYAVQGYGIARPMPAAELPNWLHSYIPNQQWLDSGDTIRRPTTG